MADYKLSFTAEEIDRKLEKVDNISWNDLTDRPFYDEEVLGEILPITNWESAADQAFVGDSLIELKTGETYTVHFNGSTYNCVAQTIDAMGDGAYIANFLGNSMAAGGPDSGEPFALLAMPKGLGVGINVYILDGSTSGTIGISGITIVTHQLDDKYLPNFINNMTTGTSAASIRTYTAAEEKDGYTLGVAAFAQGYQTKASNYYSHAEGQETISSGQASHAEGYKTEAIGDYAHAEGGNAKASGVYSHAEGSETEASGESSHAEGYGTTASITGAHAEGKSTTASGRASHAEGEYTIASAKNQHVQGKFNVEDATSAHIVGNGTSDTERSNAHTLDWQGNAWYAGDVYIKSTSGTNKDEGSKKLATEEYADNAAAAVKDDLLNGAGDAYDTLKELGDLIDENHDAIDALEIVATGKADKVHNHDDLYYTKSEIDNLELITVADIDAICGTTIQVVVDASSSEVTF